MRSILFNSDLTSFVFRASDPTCSRRLSSMMVVSRRRVRPCSLLRAAVGLTLVTAAILSTGTVAFAYVSAPSAPLMPYWRSIASNLNLNSASTHLQALPQHDMTSKQGSVHILVRVAVAEPNDEKAPIANPLHGEPQEKSPLRILSRLGTDLGSSDRILRPVTPDSHVVTATDAFPKTDLPKRRMSDDFVSLGLSASPGNSTRSTKDGTPRQVFAGATIDADAQGLADALPKSHGNTPKEKAQFQVITGSAAAEQDSIPSSDARTASALPAGSPTVPDYEVAKERGLGLGVLNSNNGDGILEGRQPAPSVGSRTVNCEEGQCLRLGTELIQAVEGPACRALLATGRCPKTCAAALTAITTHADWPSCAIECRKDVVEGAAERWYEMCDAHAETLLEQGKDVVKSIVGPDQLGQLVPIVPWWLVRTVWFLVVVIVALMVGYRRGVNSGLRLRRLGLRRGGHAKKKSSEELPLISSPSGWMT